MEVRVYFFSFPLPVQIHELEEEIVKQKQKTVNAKQDKDSKLLQKKLETLEKRLYNVSYLPAELWRPCVGPP